MKCHVTSFEAREIRRQKKSSQMEKYGNKFLTEDQYFLSFKY